MDAFTLLYILFLIFLIFQSSKNISVFYFYDCNSSLYVFTLFMYQQYCDKKKKKNCKLVLRLQMLKKTNGLLVNKGNFRADSETTAALAPFQLC